MAASLMFSNSCHDGRVLSVAACELDATTVDPDVEQRNVRCPGLG
jgi:hypothetical protein